MLDDTLQVLVLALQKQNRNSKNKIKTLVKMEIFPSTNLLMVGFKTPQGLVYKIWYRYDDGIQTSTS